MQFASLGNSTQAQAPGSAHTAYHSLSSTADEAPYSSLSPNDVDTLPNAALGPDAAQQLLPASSLPGSSPVLSDPGTAGPASSFAYNNQSSATPAGAPSTHADPHVGHTHLPPTSPDTSTSDRDAQGLSPSGEMLANSIMPSLFDSPESPNPSSLAPLPSEFALPSISHPISPSPVALHASSSILSPTTNATTQSGSVPNPNASLPDLDPDHSTSPHNAPALPPSLMTGMTDQAEPPSASAASRASLGNPNSIIAAVAAAPPSASSIATSTPSPSSSSDAKALAPGPATESNSRGPAAAPGDAQAQNIIQTDPVKEHTPVIVLASLLGAVVAAMLAGVSYQDTSHEH